MKDLRNFPRIITGAALLLASLCLLAGCEQEDHPALQLDDLTSGERLYVSRLVTLERAKAVALIDRTGGDAPLDSLALAWGDSARSETEVGVPDDPVRAGQVSHLLLRILEAELDSLIAAPRPDRLAAPLPDPLPEIDQPEAEEEPEAR